MPNLLNLKNVDTKGLTTKEVKFVLEYLASNNGAESARSAGYGVKSAKVMAFKLLQKPKIKRLVERIQRQDIKDLQLSRHEVLLQLWYALTRSAEDFCDPETGQIVTDVRKLNDRARATVDSIKQKAYYDENGEISHIDTELKLVPKATAINMAMQHKGLFAPDEVNVNLPGINFKELYADGSNGKVPDEIEGKIIDVESKRIEEQKDGID